MAGGEKELTPARGIKVRIKTPAETKLFGRGFYQVEEDCLYVPLYPSGTFYSYVDADYKEKSSKTNKNAIKRIRFSFDINRRGRLLFIKVTTPRRFWTNEKELEAPSPIEWADVRFLTFRAQVQTAGIYYSSKQSLVQLKLEDKAVAHTYNIAENIIIGISEDDYLVSVWVHDISDDRAAQQMAAWRKALRGDKTEPSPAQNYTRIEVE